MPIIIFSRVNTCFIYFVSIFIYFLMLYYNLLYIYLLVYFCYLFNIIVFLLIDVTNWNTLHQFFRDKCMIKLEQFPRLQR